MALPNLAPKNCPLSSRKGQVRFNEESKKEIHDELVQQRRNGRPRGFTFIEQAQEVKESSLEREQRQILETMFGEAEKHNNLEGGQINLQASQSQHEKADFDLEELEILQKSAKLNLTQQLFGKDCKPSCRQNVMIVDDEYMNLMGLYIALTQIGITPIVSNSGKKAL